MSGAKNIFSIISTYPFPYISCGSFEPEKKLSKKEIWLDLIFLSKWAATAMSNDIWRDSWCNFLVWNEWTATEGVSIVKSILFSKLG